MIADKGYDSQEFRQHILERGLRPVIPPRSNRKEPQAYDAYLYRSVTWWMCFINKMKHYRRVFSRLRSWTQIPGLPSIYRCPHLVTVKCQHSLTITSVLGHHRGRQCATMDLRKGPQDEDEALVVG